MQIPDANAPIPESAIFREFEDELSAMIEITEPMVQPKEFGVVNNNVPPCLDEITVTIEPDENKIRLETTNDSGGSEECGTIMYVPIPQIQQMFDWLKRKGAVK